MILLHVIVGVFDKETFRKSEDKKHFIGREVHVGDLSLGNPARLFANDGIIITSPVASWTESLDRSLKIVTENTIYYLKVSLEILK